MEMKNQGWDLVNDAYLITPICSHWWALEQNWWKIGLFTCIKHCKWESELNVPKNLENKNASNNCSILCVSGMPARILHQTLANGKGWVCETVISLIYQAGHLMTDNFNFSVKLADWLLKHPSLLTGMVVSGYLLLEPSTVVLLLHSSSFQAAKGVALAKITALHRGVGHWWLPMVSRSHCPCLCGKDLVLMRKCKCWGLCTQSTGTQVFEAGVGAKIREILFCMEWLCGSGVQILGQNPFCFLPRQRQAHQKKPWLYSWPVCAWSCMRKIWIWSYIGLIAHITLQHRMLPSVFSK